VSDTPRTDKVLYSVDVCDGEEVVNIAFARELERELNEAKELIKRLEVAAWKNYNNAHKEKEDK